MDNDATTKDLGMRWKWVRLEICHDGPAEPHRHHMWGWRKFCTGGVDSRKRPQPEETS